MAKKSTPAAQVEPEKLPVIKAPTTFNIELAGKIFNVFFGTKAFIRIMEERPSLSTCFDVMNEMMSIEAIPFLIHCAIRPQDRSWKSFDEFLDLYDECEDTASIAMVIPGYLSACGSVVKKITPALVAVEKLNESGTK
ncbi:hypothetical protein [Dyadobacter fermentans]|uniref:Uncharacterized protein n=1 Tax=Dyadobacter fermentans (strain ATCC 700827 / DSM 18053 / CIP 107007 / KCTC 52180 / NS114) TaxID=471854 RepID=C6VVH6_DYAFD|nr:hypothetical protein [Dyadobacter fermentans]ACT96706.1 hypothetical protein Dfer_5515 [Dyadobacter fermentans DSM 18053]